MPAVTIEDITASESELVAILTVSKKLRRFFAGRTFRAKYDTPIDSVDESILAIPVVAHVAPVAWATGADVEVPRLDRTYAACLEPIGETLQSMYPAFMEGGRVNVAQLVDNDVPAGSGTGLLFSGGVDSLASVARHGDDISTLIGVQGWTVDLEDDAEWERSRERATSVATTHDATVSSIASNALTMLDTPMLHAHFKQHIVGSWYSGVGHGLGLLSLCAPFSVADELDRIHIASTHTQKFDQPWGSHPDIDNHVRWGTATATHDGYELSRQEKIDLLDEYIDRTGDNIALYTCNRGEATNCSQCEKCYRTAVGLLLAGRNPQDHGYDIHPDDLSVARQQLQNGEFLVDRDTLFMWKDLKNHASAGLDHDHQAVREFFDWLSSLDLEQCFQRGTIAREDRQRRLIRSVVRNTPYPVYSFLYPVYDRLRSTG